MFKVIYTDEAYEQLKALEKPYRNKILKGIEIFKAVGKDARNSRDLKNGLYEIKSDNVRAYFKYYQNQIIIIGLVVLKKSQKSPDRYIQQAVRNIEKLTKELQEQNI
jgi:phage-related protein